jgi:hypothetical protein
MFCGAAGEALNPAEHPFNNLSALRASNWTSQFEPALVFVRKNNDRLYHNYDKMIRDIAGTLDKYKYPEAKSGFIS